VAKNSKKKLVIIVSCFYDSNSYGGHYHSAAITAEKLSSSGEYDVMIIVAGDKIVETIENCKLKKKFFHIPSGTLFPRLKKLSNFIADLKPDVIIAFDHISGFFTRHMAANNSLGFIQVKPGGGIGRGVYPKNRYQVHFASSDVVWASNRLRNEKKLIELIPNRVNEPFFDEDEVGQLIQKYSINIKDIVIIRIGRITYKYRDAFISAINLARFIRESGYGCKLFIIGNVKKENQDDVDLENEINNMLTHEDIFLREKIHTQNANRLLSIAHINVAMGRGFMEGCAAGNYMFCTTAGSLFPIHVNENNFYMIFRQNFSLRSIDNTDIENRKKMALNVINKISDGNKLSVNSRKFFDEYFTSSVIPGKYRKIISEAAKDPEKYTFDLVKCYLYSKLFWIYRYTFGKVIK
jgi:hypothetical protein